MMLMLDTNICIYILRKKPPSVYKKLARSPMEDICLSSITLAELRYGVAKSGSKTSNRAVLDSFLEHLAVLPWDAKAADYYGEIRAVLEKNGNIIGNMDMLIAAHACSIKATLITNNMNEFSRIPGLRVKNWV
ncbi:MAG: type II toxin-antitoxin system VapC family toxin [Nitrospinae bacterium]|nr:type II toxin-antitoxin system VapC family toxin [Nitrospinota bacterium]